MDFHARARELVKQIPEGRVSTYGAVAAALGKKIAARAVGRAMNQNPTPVVVPCHRVVHADGRVGGYSRGMDEKIRLLEGEGIKVEGGRVLDFENVFYDDFKTPNHPTTPPRARARRTRTINIPPN